MIKNYIEKANFEDIGQNLKHQPEGTGGRPAYHPKIISPDSPISLTATMKKESAMHYQKYNLQECMKIHNRSRYLINSFTALELPFLSGMAMPIFRYAGISSLFITI